MAKSTSCQHTEAQRALTGTWRTTELEEAVQHGYQGLHVREIWHFRAWHTGLFKTYVDTWLKLKEKASGWSTDCTTSEQREAHFTAYQAREGIALNSTNIAKNPGQRALALTP